MHSAQAVLVVPPLRPLRAEPTHSLPLPAQPGSVLTARPVAARRLLPAGRTRRQRLLPVGPSRRQRLLLAGRTRRPLALTVTRTLTTALQVEQRPLTAVGPARRLLETAVV